MIKYEQLNEALQDFAEQNNNCIVIVNAINNIMDLYDVYGRGIYRCYIEHQLMYYVQDQILAKKFIKHLAKY